MDERVFLLLDRKLLSANHCQRRREEKVRSQEFQIMLPYDLTQEPKIQDAILHCSGAPCIVLEESYSKETWPCMASGFCLLRRTGTYVGFVWYKGRLNIYSTVLMEHVERLSEVCTPPSFPIRLKFQLRGCVPASPISKCVCRQPEPGNQSCGAATLIRPAPYIVCTRMYV